VSLVELRVLIDPQLCENRTEHIFTFERTLSRCRIAFGCLGNGFDDQINRPGRFEADKFKT
jgi:hypothetical protein